MPELPYDFPHQPPENYSYEVESHKANILAIWLRHHYPYTYSSDVVRTIWGFFNTRKGEYIAPINSKKPGKVVDINDTTPYTAMQLNLNPLEYALYAASR